MWFEECICNSDWFWGAARGIGSCFTSSGMQGLLPAASTYIGIGEDEEEEGGGGGGGGDLLQCVVVQVIHGSINMSTL